MIRSAASAVMPALVAGVHAAPLQYDWKCFRYVPARMAGKSPAMTRTTASMADVAEERQ